MPMSQRTDRLDELLRQEIGVMLEREIADPRMGFATVTKVETDPDLRHARVWVSIIGGTAERGDTLVALDHSMVFIRRELGTRLRLKRIPDLHVRLDDSIERGTRILQVLDSIETGRDAGDPSIGESLPTPSRGAAPAGSPGGIGEAPVALPGPPPSPEGFGAAAAEYAAALAASMSARRDARRPRKTGRSSGRGPAGGSPGRGPGTGR
jgi:ribosome-binding factor A